VLALLGSGTAFAAYRYDRASANKVLPGVTVYGVDVGGMTRGEAIAAVQARVDGTLDRTIAVQAGKKETTVTPRDLNAGADVAAAVDRALSLSEGYSWTTRVYHRLWNKPVGQALDVPLAFDQAQIDAFVRGVAGQVAVAPRDASLDWLDGGLVRQKARTGLAVRQARGAKLVLAALQQGSETVTLPLRQIEADVTEENLGSTIIIRISENRLYLYDGLDLARTYDVATGSGGYPTPQGHWEIVNKRLNPTWVNGAKDSWGADLPDFIPPGPGNPLGTRALDLSAPGIRIHGTYADYSIGTYASHGCIRMHIPDSEELFGLVDVGTPVIIVS